MYSRRHLRAWLPFSVACLAIACTNPTDVKIEELEGFWLASQARFVNPLDEKNYNVDLIEAGYAVTLEIEASGAFSLTVDPPLVAATVVAGTMVVDGKNLTLSVGETTGQGEVFLEGDQVAFRLSAGLEYDFKGNGEPIPARLLLVMDRASGA